MFQIIFKTLMAVFVIVALVCAAQIVVLTIYLRKGTYTNTAFSQENPLAQMKVLFLGDSTAVGTGADCHHHSVAGYFANDYPSADITNISRNGLKLKELLLWWQPSAEEHYDLVVIQVGGNDILRFTPVEEIAADLPKLLARAKDVADKVVILHSGNVGEAPVFIWPFNQMMTARTLKVRAIYQAQAKAHGAIYVDLFKELADDPLVKNIPVFYSPDCLHPSGAGYRKWYEQIQRSLKEVGVKL